MKFRKDRNEEEVGYYDDPEDRRSKKRILIGSDIKHEQPIGPGECGINDDVTPDESQDEISYDEGSQAEIWKADMTQPNQGSSSGSSKRFGKFDWAGIKQGSNSDSQFRNQMMRNSNSMQNDNPYNNQFSYDSGSNHKLMRGFGLN